MRAPGPSARRRVCATGVFPIAADSAITRHLADFLRDRPRVDAVLFNGGSLHAAVLRQRLLDQIAAWQDGARPIELENAEPDLAVARGAARFGKLLHADAGRIAAGAPERCSSRRRRPGGETWGGSGVADLRAAAQCGQPSRRSKSTFRVSSSEPTSW